MTLRDWLNVFAIGPRYLWAHLAAGMVIILAVALVFAAATRRRKRGRK